MISNQKYASIGRDPSHLNKNDIIPWIPSPKVLQSPGNRNAGTWLTVGESLNMVVFLIYSENLNIFHQDVWPMNPGSQGGRCSTAIKDTFQTYVLTNLVDVMIIRGSNAPNPNCKPINTLLVPEILNEIAFVTSPDLVPSGVPFSIAKCGVLHSPFNIESWKHDRPTPGMNHLLLHLLMILVIKS